jgi:phosphatidylinositol alpha-1,6-mannosyltransferase
LSSLLPTYSIGLIAPEFPPDVGGVETYSLELARALAALGHCVTVFTNAHRGGEVELPGVPVLPLLRQRRRLDSRLLREHPMQVWHATNAAYSWLALEADNVVLSVHGNDFLQPYVEAARPDLDRLPLLWRLRGRARARLTELDVRLGQWRTRRLVERTLPRVRCVVTNSRFTESVLLKQFPACRGHTSVALVGVGDAFLRMGLNARQGDGPARLVTVCRLAERRKNVDLVIRALAELKDRYPFTYMVVGDGATRASLEGLAAELGLSDRVRFTGRVSQAELMGHLASADLFILPSSTLPGSHEGFGIAYLEANAAGAPVLAARLAGATEAVEEGVSGMFVDEPTVPQIRAAIERFLSGEVKFDAGRCREFASRFTWERVARHFTDCYARVAAPR